AQLVLEPGAARDRLTPDLSHVDDDRGLARLEKAFLLVAGSEDTAKRMRAAHIHDAQEAVKKGVITSAEGDQLAAAHAAVAKVIADEMNPARVAALRLGMGEAMVAFTMQINCGSGMQSIDTGYRYIREGVSDLILAGGAEALSYAPLVWPARGVRWFAGLAGAKGIGAKIMAALKARPAYFKPIIGLERGLTDPITELNMGQTAEVVGHLFGITRTQS